MAILAAAAVPHPPLIIPEVGRGEEKKIQSTIDAYHTIAKRVKELRPDTLIVTSPHSVMYADYFHISPGVGAFGNFADFRAPQVEIGVSYDTEFVANLADRCEGQGIPAGTLGERTALLDHATMIPMYFMQRHALNCSIVRIGLSGLPARDHYKLGQVIAKVAEKLDRRVVLIASGDLSHKLLEEGPYGFAKEGPIFDQRTVEAFRSANFLSLLQMDANVAEKAAECGLRSFWIMAGALDCREVESELLSYEGPFGVGYGTAWFLVKGSSPGRNFGDQYRQRQKAFLVARKAREDAFVRLARLSLETYVRDHRQISRFPEDSPRELISMQAGAFVSIKKDGQLRGCIGTIMPTRPSLAEEIVQNAISAGSNDPRFPSVEESELEDLVYSVDVLSSPEKILSAEELDPKRYGVIVESKGRRGLLLPDLAGVDTVEQQIEIARKKGNIGPREEVELWRFEVTRHT